MNANNTSKNRDTVADKATEAAEWTPLPLFIAAVNTAMRTATQRLLKEMKDWTTNSADEVTMPSVVFVRESEHVGMRQRDLTIFTHIRSLVVTNHPDVFNIVLLEKTKEELLNPDHRQGSVVVTLTKVDETGRGVGFTFGDARQELVIRVVHDNCSGVVLSGQIDHRTGGAYINSDILNYPYGVGAVIPQLNKLQELCHEFGATLQTNMNVSDFRNPVVLPGQVDGGAGLEKIYTSAASVLDFATREGVPLFMRIAAIRTLGESQLHHFTTTDNYSGVGFAATPSMAAPFGTQAGSMPWNPVGQSLTLPPEAMYGRPLCHMPAHPASNWMPPAPSVGHSPLQTGTMSGSGYWGNNSPL